MNSSLNELIENFSLLDDWEDRYRYVIELGQNLAPYPDALRDDAHKVNGCVSQVWLNAETDSQGDGAGDPVIHFQGDSDAHIVRGLVAIMITALSGKKASAITAFDIEATVRELGLDEHLTPQRSNGLRAMIDRMKSTAEAAQQAA
ncbi:MAG: SufE family protein [Pseudomonadota bacterium]